MMWEPIETAPMDGTWILAWNEMGIIPAVVCWTEFKSGRSGWADEDKDGEHAPMMWGGTTHWQPLPEPPVPE